MGLFSKRAPTPRTDGAYNVVNLAEFTDVAYICRRGDKSVSVSDLDIQPDESVKYVGRDRGGHPRFQLVDRSVETFVGTTYKTGGKKPEGYGLQFVG